MVELFELNAKNEIENIRIIELNEINRRLIILLHTNRFRFHFFFHLRKLDWINGLIKT